MALQLADRVLQTGTANTTVSFSLTGTVVGYQAFSSITTGNTLYYAATDGTNWEVGLGTLTSSTLLTRTNVYSSSNSGAPVTFSGTVTVWVDYPSSTSVIQNGTINALNAIDQQLYVQGGNNLLTYSSALTNAAWTTSNLTVTSSQTDPFGGTTAVLLNDGTNNGTHPLSQTVSLYAQTYTFSVYVKAGTANYVALFSSNSAQGAFFNLTTGAFNANMINAPVSYSSSNDGSGWWRLSITVLDTSAGNSTLQILVSEDGTNYSYTGTNKTIYVAAPQLELGSVASTYTPTTSAAVTTLNNLYIPNGLIYANGSAGTTGQVLSSNGTTATPSWISSGATVTPTTTNATYYVVGSSSTSGAQTVASISVTSPVSYNASTGALSAVSHVSSSDERLKSNIQTLTNAVKTVEALRGVSYLRNEKPEIGVIAQEVEKVLPMLVQADPEGYKTVAYGNMIALLIEAIKELSKEIEKLKTKVSKD
jgi:hypothetical protein